MMKPEPGKLFIVSGPSGAGKTTVIDKAISNVNNPFKIKKAITYTTRPPREGEKESSDYNFISQQEFDKLYNEGFFLETNKYNNNWYASPMDVLDKVKTGENYIIILDREGSKTVSHMVPEAPTIWITAPSIDELKLRLKKRGSSINQLESRLEIAEEEMKNEHKHTIYKYHLVNNNLNDSILEMISIFKEELAK